MVMDNTHIPKDIYQNAKSIPILEVAFNLEDLNAFKEKEIVTICPGGGMSLIAAEIMTKAGFKDVKSLTRGMDLWHKKGYPTTTAEDTEDIIYTHEDIKPGSLKGRAKIIERKQPLDEESMIEVHHTLDARNLSYPIPILKSRKH